MNTRNLKKLTNTTSYYLNELMYYATPSVGASIAKYVGIEATRGLPASELKDTIQSAFAKTAGGVNAVLLAHASMPALSVMIQAWPYLTTGQKAFVATSAVVGLAGGLYSLGVLPQEKQTMTAGGTTSLSMGLFRLSQEAASAFVVKNQQAGIAESPFLDNDVKTIRPFGR